ncbi:MAG: hypothetical protein ACRC7G_09510 [Beijerinckiaceae bacterium]
MESGIKIRPVQTASLPPARPEPTVERQVVRTELPETQSVQAAAETRPDNGLRDEQRNLFSGLNRAIDARAAEPLRKVTRDEATKELVFSRISAETGEVVVQFPDAAILRQRAYAQQILRETEAAIAAKPRG